MAHTEGCGAWWRGLKCSNVQTQRSESNAQRTSRCSNARSNARVRSRSPGVGTARATRSMAASRKSPVGSPFLRPFFPGSAPFSTVVPP